MVRIRVLGALTASGEHGELDLGGPRQRGVLARLLVARGEVVPVDRLIDDLWRGEPPPRALGSLQAYVSNLRRLLEPERAPRAPATVLISRAPGYALRLDTEAVDAWLFGAELDSAAQQTDPQRRRRALEQALARWQGPAYGAYAQEAWAAAEAARLEELRLSAREQLAATLLEQDEPALAAAEADVLAREHPLREEAWRLTALARYRAGRQADALAALRQAREVLADELGIDPGPALTRLETDILAQRIPVQERVIAESRPSPDPVPASAATVLFGRDAELAALHAAARGEGPRTATVTGEAGSGKSALLQRLRDDLRDAGYRVVIGRCPEDEAAPSAWPWVEILRALAAQHDPGELAPVLAPLLTDGAGPYRADGEHGRFLLHRAVGDYLTAVATARPLAILLDDAHRGDAETAAMLAAVTTRASAFVVIGYRPDEVPPVLADALASSATTVRARIRLRGLGVADSARLVGTLTGSAPADPLMATLHDRTGGNPFYLIEIARLVQSEGELVAAAEVPEGVRDVLRRRLSRLPGTAVSVLRLAAVIGREFDLAVLVRAAEVGEDEVLDAVEAGVVAGLLDEPASGRARFAHVLVRDTLLGDLSRIRRDRWHRRIGAAIEEIDPDDVTAIAHHYGESVTPQTARRAADYAVAAAQRAERRFAHDVAAAGYERAALALERHPGGDTVDERMELLCRAARSHLVCGAGLAARAARDRAATLAEHADRPDLLVRAFTAWDAPTPWMNRRYGVVDHAVVARIETALRWDGLSAADRCRLSVALVDEIGGAELDRARRVAADAEAIARDLGDDTLLAPALQARASLYDSPDRSALGAELIEIGRRNDHHTYLLLGHTVALQAAAFAGDPEAARAHLEAATVPADRYQWRQAQAANAMARGLLALVGGDAEDAERRYLEAAELLARTGIFNAGTLPLMALFTVRLYEGRAGELAETIAAFARDADADTADATVDFHALVLLAAGDRDAAARVRRRARPIPEDLFRSLFLTLRGMVIAVLGTPEEAAALYRDLLRYRDRLGGADTGSFTVGPVDLVLADLAALCGDPELAAEHCRAALRIAERCANRGWIDAARARLDH